MPDKDVLGKADALLRRHTLPLPGAGGEASPVPVLTELVEAPASASPESELAQAIFERVMQEVDGRLATAVGDLRQQLASAVSEAIRQELERRHVK